MSDYEFEEEEVKARLSRRTLLRILAQARPHWRWIVGFVLTVAIVSVLDSYYAFLRKQIVDQGILAGNRAVFTQAIIAYGLTILVQAAGVFSFIFLAGVLGERIQYDLRQKMFDHLQELSFSYFDRTPVGWIMARLTSDTERIAHLATWGLLDVTWGALNLVTSVAFMLLINWKLTLIVLAMIPVLLVVAAQFSKKIIVEYRTVRRMNSKISGAYNENITGVRVVKALCRDCLLYTSPSPRD